MELKFVSERNRYVNNHEYCGDMKMYAERRAFLFNSGSSIFLQFPLAPIYHSWKFSNKFCPSAKYHSSCIQKSMLKFYSSMKNPSYEKSLCKDLWKTEDLCKAKFYSKNIRNYSSSKESSCNKSKLKECDKIKLETLAKQEIPKCCTKDPYACKKPEHIQECVKPITKCLPSVGDTPFICTSTPCPSIEDYCPPEVYTHEEKIWQILTCIGLLSVVIMSCYVYNKSKDWDKEPRPEFRDVPYLRRIVKPFPWGDGKHTLFHNPARNPISPHGYETEDPSIKKKIKNQKSNT
ncbi:uncharacterized protein LOC100867546 isoform X3 [Apis florea]|uniref:uncharacterized protein LOC100867546 isoform X3 n=1 Tax=Apis florea TaxID=7463 RepID=UPI000629CF14|nr:uncharacterized protein LOC100867546 isoform X3 [Apis florea]